MTCGFYFTENCRFGTSQPGLEFEYSKPWLESSIFEFISWLNGSYFVLGIFWKREDLSDGIEDRCDMVVFGCPLTIVSSNRNFSKVRSITANLDFRITKSRITNVLCLSSCFRRRITPELLGRLKLKIPTLRERRFRSKRRILRSWSWGIHNPCRSFFFLF